MYDLLGLPPMQQINQTNLPGYVQAPLPQGMLTPQEPSLLDRLKSGIGGLLSSAVDSVRPKAPAGYEGLLTPDEIKSARPGLLRSIIHAEGAPSADQLYEQRLNGIVQRKAATLELGQHAQELQRRQAVIQMLHERYPNFATMTPDAQRQAVVGIFGDLLANGEFDAAGKIASTVGAMQNQQNGPALQHVDAGGTVKIIDPRTGAVVQEYPKTPTPRDPNAPSTAEMRREQMLFTRQAQLSDDFRQSTKQYATVADMIGTATQAGQRALQGDPQAQQSLIFAFMKLLDPGSTVREGEYASAKNAGSIPEKLQAQYNGVLKGTLLSPSQVQRMLEQIQAQARGWKQRFDPQLKRYIDTAKRAGVNPDDVVYDYFKTLGAAIPAAPAAPARPAGRVNPLLQGGR